MYEPGWVNVSQFIIERIENQPSDNQSNHKYRQDGRMKHAQQHSHVVHSKQHRAEKICEPDAYEFLQRYKSESPEEKLLQERIHNGNVNRHIEKVFCRNSHFGGQIRSYAAEIDKASRYEVASKNHPVYCTAQQERHQ